MEANSHEKMVQEKLSRRSETTGTLNPPIFTSEITSTADHKFKQTFYIQESFEPRKFLLWRYNKKVGSTQIPVDLCAICNKLEIEHYA